MCDRKIVLYVFLPVECYNQMSDSVQYYCLPDVVLYTLSTACGADTAYMKDTL
jgi:hypothetical protein